MSTTKELRDQAKALGIEKYWLKNKATLAAEIAARSAATEPAAEVPAPKMTAAGRALMAAIGRHDFSFFDDGITEGSGIWHECLTGEYAGTAGAPATARGVADVIRGLAKQGMLRVLDGDEDDRWVDLTAAGAETANALADEPKPEAAPAPAAATARTFDAAGLDEFTCPECGETKPVSRFVTKNGTTLRYRECRACATARRAAK